MICLAVNLPAFERAKDLLRYLNRFAPSEPLGRVWQCEHCNGYHSATEIKPLPKLNEAWKRKNRRQKWNRDPDSLL